MIPSKRMVVRREPQEAFPTGSMWGIATDTQDTKPGFSATVYWQSEFESIFIDADQYELEQRDKVIRGLIANLQADVDAGVFADPAYEWMPISNCIGKWITDQLSKDDQ